MSMTPQTFEKMEKLTRKTANFIAAQNSLLLDSSKSTFKTTTMLAFNAASSGIWNMKKLSNLLDVKHGGTSVEYFEKIIAALKDKNSAAVTVLEAQYKKMKELDDKFTAANATSIKDKIAVARKA